jgi:hypothetical protein
VCAVTYWFKYGEITAYGSETPRRLTAAEPEVQQVSEPIGGLTPDTLYHFGSVWKTHTVQATAPGAYTATYTQR